MTQIRHAGKFNNTVFKGGGGGGGGKWPCWQEDVQELHLIQLLSTDSIKHEYEIE